MKLTKELYMVQQSEQPITMNSLIASSLIYHADPKVSFKDIKNTTKTLYDYIKLKKFKNYISTMPQNYDINLAALSLGFQVSGTPNDRKTGD